MTSFRLPLTALYTLSARETVEGCGRDVKRTGAAIAPKAREGQTAAPGTEPGDLRDDADPDDPGGRGRPRRPHRRRRLPGAGAVAGPTRAWNGTRAATGWSDAGACRAGGGGPPISLPTMGGDQRIAQAS